MRDISNSTALHYASDNENKEVIQYLVEDLKCDVGEFVGACLHMTACENVYLQSNKNNQSPQGWWCQVGRPMGRDGNLLPCMSVVDSPDHAISTIKLKPLF